jgi:hypothetical protein
MKNKLLFGNGIKIDTAPCAFALDILGTEISQLYENRVDYHTYRMMAGQKPFVILNDKNSNDIDFWQKALFYGFIISARSAELEKNFMKYTPVIIKMNELGWEPMTYARSNDETILIERWGPSLPDNTVCFTLRNSSMSHKTVKIQFDLEKMGLKKKKAMTLSDMFTKNRITAISKSGSSIIVTIKISAGETRALELI